MTFTRGKIGLQPGQSQSTGELVDIMRNIKNNVGYCIALKTNNEVGRLDELIHDKILMLLIV